ncbi:transcriptional regulator with XRE-family HTH domain [Enterococcus sp. PF1-24]|uniref:helix-turn-helix domain-containing protein n=1 Tax=unclassified Enterococcus TaxID=2608891 RepID=UPI002474BCD5|nr:MULTISPECIES: helix-turn-helix transcriptional regulator [unclassified Enterococcus]MDH6365663.1 transcriptional regulator with XRE-family HTH domain [Enterococcus sp. PFB1-1]MDH6402756.1 transcriptional regulator with XRE-family HTH domain [Enterococcus sp. PF1-24]
MNEEISLSIGEKIRDGRVEKKWSQKHLAEKVYVSPQAVSKWENDKSLPDIETLYELEKILSVSLISQSTALEPENDKYTPTEENKKESTLYVYFLLIFNFFWTLFCFKYFQYEHHSIQYTGLTFLFGGMIILTHIILKKFQQDLIFKIAFITVNMIIFLITTITQLTV